MTLKEQIMEEKRRERQVKMCLFDLWCQEQVELKHFIDKLHFCRMMTTIKLHVTYCRNEKNVRGLRTRKGTMRMAARPQTTTSMPFLMTMPKTNLTRRKKQVTTFDMNYCLKNVTLINFKI